MKQRFAAVFVALLAVLGLLVGAPTQAHADVEPLPSDASGFRFWTGSLCVQSGANTTGYPIAYQAQQWNLRVGNTAVLAINHRADCAAAGYPPSRRFTVGVFSDPNNPACSAILNNDTDYYNGMYRWTNHPVVLINYGRSGCTNTTARLYHFTGAAIGSLLGMKPVIWQNSLNRVMNGAIWSAENVLYPTQVEGDRVWSIYTDAYGG